MSNANQDMAYLALLAGEAQQLPYVPGAPTSRRALVTAFCYSKIAGVPLAARFLVFPLDPARYTHLVPAVQSLPLAAQHRLWLTEQRAQAQAVLAALAPLTPARLDQAAALHFLALHLKQQGTPAFGPAVVGEFLAAQADEGWQLTPGDAATLFVGLVKAGVIDYGEPAPAAAAATPILPLLPVEAP